MKKLCYSAFVAFWSSIATLLALYSLAAEQGGGGKVYGLAEVEQHNSLEDCWLVIEGKVYDVTGYVEQHPAPPSVLAPWCGGEATEGMRTKGYGRDHSEAAWELLESYRIGTFKQQ